MYTENSPQRNLVNTLKILLKKSYNYNINTIWQLKLFFNFIFEK